MIRNPVLPGWHPEPSILRVGREYAPSHGVWAPSLHHDPVGGRYLLVYSVVSSTTAGVFDVDIVVVTAPDPRGPWSEPSYLSSVGFDPSLFRARTVEVATSRLTTTTPGGSPPWSGFVADVDRVRIEYPHDSLAAHLASTSVAAARPPEG